MTAAPARSTAAPRVPRSVLWVSGLGLGAVLALALAVAVGGARPVPGLAAAGPVVDWGRPVAALAARIAAVGTVGALLFAGFLLPDPGSAAWRRAVRAAAGGALA